MRNLLFLPLILLGRTSNFHFFLYYAWDAINLCMRNSFLFYEVQCIGSVKGNISIDKDLCLSEPDEVVASHAIVVWLITGSPYSWSLTNITLNFVLSFWNLSLMQYARSWVILPFFLMICIKILQSFIIIVSTYNSSKHLAYKRLIISFLSSRIYSRPIFYFCLRTYHNTILLISLLFLYFITFLFLLGVKKGLLSLFSINFNFS